MSILVSILSAFRTNTRQMNRCVNSFILIFRRKKKPRLVKLFYEKM